MRKSMAGTMLALLAMILLAPLAWAHFGIIMPSDDIVTKEDDKTVTIDVKFMHPMEGHYMQMDKPKVFGVMHLGKKQDLLGTLRNKKSHSFDTWVAEYRIKRPGDYIFFVEPSPYWEPAEDLFIIHYTKVVVGALGMEEGWDREVGLPTEITPLTRPYGLWAGNVFQGVVKKKGKPVPHAEVEVEFYNERDKIVPPADPYITQVVKADENGVFTYAMPRAGWWGFSALNKSGYTIKHEGQEKGVEIGAVIWIRTREMR